MAVPTVRAQNWAVIMERYWMGSRWKKKSAGSHGMGLLKAASTKLHVNKNDMTRSKRRFNCCLPYLGFGVGVLWFVNYDSTFISRQILWMLLGNRLLEFFFVFLKLNQDVKLAVVIGSYLRVAFDSRRSLGVVEVVV